MSAILRRDEKGYLVLTWGVERGEFCGSAVWSPVQLRIVLQPVGSVEVCVCADCQIIVGRCGNSKKNP